jgi:HD-GYP domain-containing protein (c-di-GMP phosphodiesterase class II)
MPFPTMVPAVKTPDLSSSAPRAGSAAESASYWVRWFSEASGLPWSCYDALTGGLVSQSDAVQVPYCSLSLRVNLSDITTVAYDQVEAGLLCVAVRSPSPLCHHVLTTYVRLSTSVRPQELVLAATHRNWSENEFQAYLSTVPCVTRAVVEKLVASLLQQLRQVQREVTLQQDLERLGHEIDRAYEEISFLHALTENLQLSCQPAAVAELCLQRLSDLVRAAGHSIVLEDHEGESHFLSKGRMPLDQLGLGRLIARFENHDWSRPLVKNHLNQTLVGADFPGLQSFIAVAIGEVPFRRGWIFCCNTRSGQEFGTVEATLLGSVAAILGTHLRNLELYCEHDELLIGFVRSLVSTLDAKDPYTRGHSERVALITRRLGKQLMLPDGDQDDLYLSALLHDIGKVGVDERILRKPDQLTEDEFRQIQLHPMIGYQILAPLKSLHHILPGVRSHHEAINGRGYPDRLRGDEIPLMARIIAVADAYDAMVSDRPYRKGMPLDRLEEIFRKGAGEQWDARVIEAYFAARDDICSLCQSYVPSTGNLLEDRRGDRPGSLSGRLYLRH